MSQGLPLLDLAPELIHACLLFLPLDDIASCLHAGSRLLTTLILNSPSIRYRIEQEEAGVEENPYSSAFSGLDTSARLAALRARERRWREFDPVSRHTIEYPTWPVLLYTIRAGLWLEAREAHGTGGSALADSLSYIDMAPQAQPAVWHTVFSGTNFANFATALEEHDLLVIFTVITCPDDASMVSIDALMLTFSTGSPHPIAVLPKVHITRRASNNPISDLNAEISGDLVALAIYNEDEMYADTNCLYAFNWKSGNILLGPVVSTTFGLAFLSPRDLMIASATENCLFIYSFSDSSSALVPTTARLWLPGVRPRTSISGPRMQCRRSPSPHNKLSHPQYYQAQFPPVPNSAHVFLSYETIDLDSDDREMHPFVLFPGYILDVVQSIKEERDGNVDGGEVEIEWKTWGKTCTRWLEPQEVAGAWILASSGHRMVAYPPYDPVAPRDQPKRMKILDFNPYGVAALRSLVDNGPGAPANIGDHRRLVRTDSKAFQKNTPGFMHFDKRVRSDNQYIEITVPETFTFDNVYLSEEFIVGRTLASGDTVGARGGVLEVLYFG
ncbi:hypothetical protein MIND_00637400 [Mycena indigotica]|uniref:F-box domain-containing protein n=1 Tax=Mycena indigotica TaxID=2126181 RepID=A0A8H6SUA7_9AGAR|nr:uncharacterized protein MIND_00637400 [Mycena indigotica]KAF7304060.1 hypothetical protein MIND_00637400 [Mycena indigotica]